MREQFFSHFSKLQYVSQRSSPLWCFQCASPNYRSLLSTRHISAILHYQLAYRLQNHVFDMAVLDMAQSNDALLIQVDPGMTPMCTFVPRQLTRDQMTSLFLEWWITKYEMLHQATRLVQSNNPFFIRKENGEVETIFLVTPPEKKDVTIFPTQIAML